MKVKIGMPFKTPGIAIDRFGKWDIVIPYTIENAGTFEVRLPEEDWTPEKGEAAVREAARRQLVLFNKEIEI